jgi:hypothetical protein
VKLVEGGQLLGREVLIFRSKGSERRFHPRGEAGRAIVVAHAIQNIVHCSLAPRVQTLAADIRALPASDYPR